MSGYKINSADIDGILHYLQVFHPNLATREFAEFYLNRLHENVKDKLSDVAENLVDDPEKFEAIMEEIIKEFPSPKS